MGHVEPEPQRQQMMPRLPAQAPAYSQPAFNSSYMGPPAMTSYYPTMQPTPPPQQQVSGLYYQRPLPQVSIEVLGRNPPEDNEPNDPSRLTLPYHLG